MSVKKIVVADQSLYFEKIIKISKRQRMLRDVKNKSILQKIEYAFLTRKRNRLAPKRNIWLQGKIGKNPKIFHANVIVNQYAEVGDNVVFHGNNCIGNDGKNLYACPKIGNNVEIGYGATIIGNIVIADDTVIGAGAVVTHSCEENGCTLAGVPARVTRKNKRGKK